MATRFTPDTRPYPADYLDWVASLHRFNRLKAENRGGWWTITFDSQVHMPGHAHGVTYFSTFTLLPATVLDSVDWRRLVAAHLRRVRFGCRRQARPGSVIGVKAPKLPFPP